MAKGGSIETGVDRLLSIIRKQGRISLDEAAKLLGVSQAVAEEWGDFLEDEKFIKKEFKLTKTYFVIATFDSKDVIQKAQEFQGRKEGFIRQAEVAIANLDHDSKVIMTLRDEFEKLQKDMEKELKGMKVELKELEKYELLKGNLDKQVEIQKQELQKKINEINEQVKKEQSNYEKLLKEIDVEKVKLEKEKEEEFSIRDTELALKTKLSEIVGSIDKLKVSIKENDAKIGESAEHITKLTNLTERIKQDVGSKKSLIDNLLLENKKIEMQILKAQSDLMAKVAENQKLIQGATGGKAEDRFKQFFTKKNEITKLMNDISSEKELLEKDLTDLIKKARAFKLTEKSKDVTKQLEELQKMLDEAEKKRQSYEKKMQTLATHVGVDAKPRKKSWLFG